MVRISWWKPKIIKSQKYKYQRRGRYKKSSADNKAYVKYWIISKYYYHFDVFITVFRVNNKGRNIFSIILSTALKLFFLRNSHFLKGI